MGVEHYVLKPIFLALNITQIVFTYSKSTIETLEKGVTYVQS